MFRSWVKPNILGELEECGEQEVETTSCIIMDCPPACFMDNSTFKIGELVSEDKCTTCYCREAAGIICSDKETAIGNCTA